MEIGFRRHVPHRIQIFSILFQGVVCAACPASSKTDLQPTQRYWSRLALAKMWSKRRRPCGPEYAERKDGPPRKKQ